MCETIQSPHLLSDVLGVEVFFLSPTGSGDVAGARFCVPLPSSPPPFRGMVENTIFGKLLFYLFFLKEVTVWSRVGTSTGGNFEDYIRFVSCHLFGPVNHGQN